MGVQTDSSRKRMSVIVKDQAGTIFLLCKGADSIIFDMLAEEGKFYQPATIAHLSDYAEDGLRTLAFAYRKIDPSDYENWNSIFTKARTTISPEREILLGKVSEITEKDLILLGAVAVEDKLQKGVPECTDKLAQAGIKMWLLTGDKKETAINIGFACSLLRHDMKQFQLGFSKEAESNNDTKVHLARTFQVTILRVLIDRSLSKLKDALKGLDDQEDNLASVSYLLLPSAGSNQNTAIIDWDCFRSSVYFESILSN